MIHVMDIITSRQCDSFKKGPKKKLKQIALILHTLHINDLCLK